MHFTSEKYGKVITQINLGHINGVNFFLDSLSRL